MSMRPVQLAVTRTVSRGSILARTMSDAIQSHDHGNVFSDAFARSVVHDEGTSPYFEGSRLEFTPSSTVVSGITAPQSDTVDLEKSQTAPRKHGFFSSSIRKTRLQVLRTLTTSLVVMGILIMGILSIYWGSFFRRQDYLNRVSFWIVNMDDSAGSLVGPNFISLASEFSVAAGSAQVEVRDASSFGYSYDAVYNDVIQQHTWGAFIVQPNATESLLSALANPSSAQDYDGTAAIQFVYPQAREPQLYIYLVPWVSSLNTNITAAFSEVVIQMVAQNSSYSLSAIAMSAPQVLSTPVAINSYNIRPFDNPISTAVLQVGLIYLIIISFFQFNFFQPVHMILAPQLKRVHYILYRMAATWIAYFFLSLFYSLISLAFQIDFTRAFGRAGFVIYWMINWLGMAAVGGACENIALIAVATYPPLIGFWLIFMVISNVSVAFFAIPLEAGIYRYGYAFPIKNICDAVKTVLFNTKDTLGLNIGVLVAWIAVNTFLLPFCIWFSGYRMQQKKVTEELKAKSEKR
ncbi:uncharacterized protein V1513DRAFT_249331 [Lipomyces chichibuensis]|uniref:uncharacterized protein n=1 Tax=Lipomyces chichibuensis TaxID=1546026 RepID=UPI003343B894